LYRSTDRADVVDAHWARVLRLFDSLEHEQETLLLEIVQQTIVDTVSNLLGVLDGSSPLPGVDEELWLGVGSDASGKLNGELQDTFLELVEQESEQR